MLVASSLETKSSVRSTSFAPDTLAGKCTALSEKNFLSSERVVNAKHESQGGAGCASKR